METGKIKKWKLSESGCRCLCMDVRDPQNILSLFDHREFHRIVPRASSKKIFSAKFHRKIVKPSRITGIPHRRGTQILQKPIFSGKNLHRNAYFRVRGSIHQSPNCGDLPRPERCQHWTAPDALQVRKKQISLRAWRSKERGDDHAIRRGRNMLRFRLRWANSDEKWIFTCS